MTIMTKKKRNYKENKSKTIRSTSIAAAITTTIITVRITRLTKTVISLSTIKTKTINIILLLKQQYKENKKYVTK